MHRTSPVERTCWAFMKKIEVYTTPLCPYCSHAKRLLDSKSVAYT
ncbi:MAG: glutaredoxin domain-containing protein, partial [Geminicoccaceae bacterium]